MSLKNPSLKVYLQKNLPKALCGYKFYDSFIKKLSDVSPHKAWTVFHQEFVDEFFNKDIRRNPALVPVEDRTVVKVGPSQHYRKVYQAKNSEIAVIITVRGVTVNSVENQLKTETTLLDLDNFDSTGFKSTSCYVISRVLTVDMLKIEVTLNGDVFYEHTVSVGVPVCFHANKVRLLEDGRGLLEDMKPVKKKLPLNIMQRRAVQHFLNSFLPNQNRLGNAVGDAPAVLNWQEPRSLRSYRPNFLPRPERPHQTDLIYYYKTDQELIELIYGHRKREAAGKKPPERRYRNRPRDRRPEVAVDTSVDERGVNNEPYDEVHTIHSEDESTVTSVESTGATSDDSCDDTSDDEDTSDNETSEITNDNGCEKHTE